MRWTVGSWTGRSTVLRLLLVVALGVGLAAMHVLAGVQGHQHAAAAERGVAAVSAPTASPSAVQLDPMVQVAPGDRAAVHVGDHEHHPSGDCVLFLGAGTVLLLLLLVRATARALRASWWPSAPWSTAVGIGTPWRGPPPERWPRISLCVIRV